MDGKRKRCRSEGVMICHKCLGPLMEWTYSYAPSSMTITSMHRAAIFNKTRVDFLNLLELEQDILIRLIFLSEIEDATQRVSIGLRLWAGATMAAKATRPTHNVPRGQQNYTLPQMQADFREADAYAQDDGLCLLGVQIAPILELFIRTHDKISLEGAEADSEVRKYLKVKGKNDITKEDIEILNDNMI